MAHDSIGPPEAAVETIEAVLSGRLSRREFVRRAGILGLSASTIGSVLVACGESETTSPAAVESAVQGTTAAAAEGSSSAAAFDPKKYAGTTVSILMTGDEQDHRALGDKVGELEEQTGIKLEITSPALGALIEKTLQTLKADSSPFDLINYLGFLTTQQVGGGYYDQLNQYIDDPAETPPDWDFADFLPPAMKNVGIYDLEAKKLGEGSDVYGIPGLHSGSVIYFYRKDLFDEAGLEPPKTWEDFAAAAEQLHTDDVAGCSFIGANDFSLATVDWYTRFITTGGSLMSGSPVEKNFTPNVDSPEGVAALQMLIDLLPYAPKNVTQYGFAENVDGFSSGKIAQMIFWSTIAGPIFDPEKSTVADKTAVTGVMASEGQQARAIQGGWGVGIPKNSDPAKKAAAWRALTWITSKEFNNYEAEKYQIDASRTSTYNDPGLVENFPYLPTAGEATGKGQIIETSLIDEFFQMNDVMNVEFNKALIGGQDAKTACSNVQEQWTAMLKKAGHLA